LLTGDDLKDFKINIIDIDLVGKNAKTAWDQFDRFRRELFHKDIV